jgi:hypothetical protein
MTPHIPPNPRAIEIVAFPGVQLLDVAGPLQVFESANVHRRQRGEQVPYLTRVIAHSSPVISSAGLGLVCSRLSRSQEAVDTLIVAGGAGVHAAIQGKLLVRWLATRSQSARRLHPFVRVRSCLGPQVFWTASAWSRTGTTAAISRSCIRARSSRWTRFLFRMGHSGLLLA